MMDVNDVQKERQTENDDPGVVQGCGKCRVGGAEGPDDLRRKNAAEQCKENAGAPQKRHGVADGAVGGILFASSQA